jgi:hypothetical protein
MNNKILKRGIIFVIVMLFIGTCVAPTINADLEDDIEASIVAGIDWLISQQADGCWGTYEYVAHTGFVLIKLQDRAYELGMNPFETDFNQPDFCPWAVNVIAGWNFVFNFITKVTPLPLNFYGDDPDTNGNGYGLYFSTFGSHPTYTTGIVLMALSASRAPNRPNEGGHDFDMDGLTDTYGEIAQECVDWFAWSQLDLPDPGGRGGWRYEPTDNWADNSNSGYAVLGLAAAEAFTCTVPDFVKEEINYWIDYIQNDVDGDPDDGGSGYTSPNHWVNLLKTGNLIFEMTFSGDNPTVPRFMDAIDYIERTWKDISIDPGWGYLMVPAHYQAMYCLMKGFVYSQINLIDLDNDGINEHDWYTEFAQVLVDQQNIAGFWPADYWGNQILSTVWALLILERSAPPPPVANIYVDIKPGSCPNPIQLSKKGVTPAAICGTDDFDVMDIDPCTIRIGREGGGYVEVAPVRYNYEDVATPFIDECEDCNCDDRNNCHTLKEDGYLDLTLKFSTPEIVAYLLNDTEEGDVLCLYITGEIIDGPTFYGEDVIWIRESGHKINENPIYLKLISFLQQYLNMFPILRCLLEQ